MDQLITTFLERKADWLTALFEHLRISLLALIIAIAIAVPLGLVLSNKKKLTEWSLQVTGVFQTIPSLALLGLFIPFMGIGTLPAVVALVIYAIFPILQGDFDRTFGNRSLAGRGCDSLWDDQARKTA